MNSAGGIVRPLTTVFGVDKDPEDHKVLEKVRRGLDKLSKSIDTFRVTSFVAPREPPQDGSGIPPW
jgi:hypothetical protein